MDPDPDPTLAKIMDPNPTSTKIMDPDPSPAKTTDPDPTQKRLKIAKMTKFSIFFLKN